MQFLVKQLCPLYKQQIYYMKTYLPVLLIFVSLISLSSFQSDNSLKDRVLKQVKDLYTNFPIEKVYVHTDKPYYALGETIWFKAYLLDGITHQFITPSKSMYIELIDPNEKIVQRRTLQNIYKGIAGDFQTKEDWKPGNYIMRGYTRYMQNFPHHFFFQKEIQILDKNEEPKAFQISVPTASTVPKFEVQFFPEGGDMIEGLSSKIGFKAVGADGNGIQVDGKIFDNKGNFISLLKPIKFGLGFFTIIPEPGKTYTAEVIYNGITKTFDLPIAKPKGYTLKTLVGKDQSIKVLLESNLPDGLNGTLLHGHIRGHSFIVQEMATTERKMGYQLNTDSLRSGVAHLTLFSKAGQPVCERLIFIDNPNRKIEVDLQTAKEKYSKRSKVDLNIQLSSLVPDHNLQSDLSISVVDKNLVQHPANELDIRSYLLLNSEIRGRIEQPGFYFNEENQGAKTILDLLMMVQGWRRFEWESLLKDQFPEIQYPPETGFSIKGKVTKVENQNKPIEAQVFLNTLDFQVSGELTTKEDGLFTFSGLVLEDTTTIVLQANKFNKKAKKRKNKSEMSGPSGNRYVAIHVLPKSPPLKIEKEWTIPAILPPTTPIEDYLLTQQYISTIDSNYRQMIVNFDEITIKAKKKSVEDVYNRSNQLYSAPDDRIIVDSMAIPPIASNSVFDLIQGRVAGVVIQGVFPNQRAIIRGFSSLSGDDGAMILLDGIPIDQSFANNISVMDIAYVDVLKGAGTTAMFGSRGGNGVIAIYTRVAAGLTPYNAPRMGIIDFEHPGYYKARQFYAPNYDTKLPDDNIPDFRTTLYWNPDLETDENGTTSLSFYTDDKATTYFVEVQGISQNGIPIKGITEIQVGMD